MRVEVGIVENNTMIPAALACLRRMPAFVAVPTHAYAAVQPFGPFGTGAFETVAFETVAFGFGTSATGAPAKDAQGTRVPASGTSGAVTGALWLRLRDERSARPSTPLGFPPISTG